MNLGLGAAETTEGREMNHFTSSHSTILQGLPPWEA